MNHEHKKDDIAGGQALIEGVMMRHGDKIAAAVRKPDGEIVFRERHHVPLTKRYKLLGLIVVRGFVTLFEMMFIGMKNLLFSSEVALTENEEKPSVWQLALAMVISMGTALFFFIIVPAYCFSLLKGMIVNTFVLNIVEGCIRMGLFFIFLGMTLLMDDMKRVFMYHGAEHKTVFAWEEGEELTIENVRSYSTRHPRCGTSFILIVMIVSIMVFSLLGRPDFLHRVLYKLTLLPLVSGISYEIIRFTGRHKDWRWVQILSWPGLQFQGITTREPTDDQLEVAIAAMEKVI
ncbi:MAG: DUF1385 domain-containing protein [Syntrophales bacterium]